MTSAACLRLAAGLLAAVALVVTWGAGLSAQRTEGRVVAIGDVHGSDDGLTAILRAAGLIDQAGRWAGGTATLVQTGDVTDRGAGVKRALDLVRALGPDAAKAGGRVVSVLGNHEIMNLVGELRDVTPAICASFAGRDPEATREKAWRTYENLVERRARLRPDETPLGLVRTQEGFRAAYPPGCVEYRLALGPGGDYGRSLRERPIAALVQGTVFMHAGASPLAELATIDQLNTRARDEVRRFDRFVERLVRANLAAPWFRLEDVLAVAAAEVRWVNALVTSAKTRGDPPDLSGIDVELTQEAAEVLGIGDWSLLDGDGPLWYRGYALADEAGLAEPFTALLKHWGADRLVVGHTVNRDFRIQARLGGRVFLIDTGMLAPVYKGIPSALELDNGRATALYADGTRTPLGPLPPP
jgi:hypothetical protein